MKKAKGILLGILVLVVIGFGYFGYNFYIQTVYFLSTEDSKIAANMVTITPEITGKVLDWNVKDGDFVKVGQVLGKQDVTMLMNSNAINPAALSSTADSLVNKAEIKAPFGGKIIHTTIVEGQVLSPGMCLLSVKRRLQRFRHFHH